MSSGHVILSLIIVVNYWKFLSRSSSCISGVFYSQFFSLNDISSKYLGGITCFLFCKTVAHLLDFADGRSITWFPSDSTRFILRWIWLISWHAWSEAAAWHGQRWNHNLTIDFLSLVLSHDPSCDCVMWLPPFENNPPNELWAFNRGTAAVDCFVRLLQCPISGLGFVMWWTTCEKLGMSPQAVHWWSSLVITHTRLACKSLNYPAIVPFRLKDWVDDLGKFAA